MSEISLFDCPAENPVDVEGPTVAALLGDGSPAREPDSEGVDVLAAAGVEFGDRCPSCGAGLPDNKHLVDRAFRAAAKHPDP